MRKIARLLFFAILLLGFHSCSNNDRIITEIKPGFEKYISGFTSGAQLSRGTKIVIRFQQSVNDSVQEGQEVQGEAFEFKPSIKEKPFG